jgi:hypothetical protein
MTRYSGIIRPVLLLLLAAVFAFFLQFRSAVPGFTYLHHDFSLDAGRLAAQTGLVFVLLLGAWASCSAVFSRSLKIAFRNALTLDFPTYAPLAFLALTPLVLRHYLTRDDLDARLGLLLAAVIVAVLYLKAAGAGQVLKNKPAAWLARLRNFHALPLRRRLIILFIASLVIYNVASILMLSRGLSFSGDEPHYLLITHSLVHDGDFDLTNNYNARDYSRFLAPESTIVAHTLAGKKTGTQYSFHSPGISFLLLPFYALGELLGKTGLILLVRFGMSLFGALFGIQIYLYALQEWKKTGLAFTLWLLTGLTVPVFFYAVSVYPEIVIALFALTAFRLLRFSGRMSPARLALLGFLLTSFIWFHALKYFFLMGPLFVYALWILIVKRKVRAGLAWFMAWPVLGTALYFYFQYALYGSLNPTAVSWQGAMDGPQTLSWVKTLFTGIPFRFRLDTLLGYFLDQRDGLLLYAPIYFIALLGIVEAARRKRKDLGLLLFIAAPYVLVSAFLTQRTGYAPQARPLVAVIWVMALLLGHFLAHNAKPAFHRLLNYTAGLSLIFVVLLCLSPLSLFQETTVGAVERGGELFYRLSHLHFYLPKLLPSFLKVEEWRWFPNFVWPVLVALFIVAYLLASPKKSSPRRTGPWGFALGGLALFFLWFVFFPRTILTSPRPVTLASGERIVFYRLSRVARMNEPARFSLLEDDRDYYFYFSSRRPVAKLQADFGSKAGDYTLKLGFLDQPVFEETTRRETRSRVVDAPPPYRWNGTNLYRVTISLEKKSDVRTGINPYLFAIRPVR